MRLQTWAALGTAVRHKTKYKQNENDDKQWKYKYCGIIWNLSNVTNFACIVYNQNHTMESRVGTTNTWNNE